jgi:hypothetical protein
MIETILKNHPDFSIWSSWPRKRPIKINHINVYPKLSALFHGPFSWEFKMSGVGIRGSEGLVLTSVGGIALVGNALCRYTDFRSTFTRTFHKGRGGIAWGDVLTPYVASLATGKSDFEALRPWFGQTWVAKALRVDRVASPETLRQHLDNLADGHLEEALRMCPTTMSSPHPGQLHFPINLPYQG